MKEKLENPPSADPPQAGKLHCPECHKVIVYDPALKSGDHFDCPCGKITVQLYTVTTLKGKVLER